MHLIAITEILVQLYFINHAIKNNKPRHWLWILLIPWAGFIIYFFTAFSREDVVDNTQVQRSSGPKCIIL